MRLIQTQRLKLLEYPGEPGKDIPPYAILSHTWGEDEVSFQEMQNGTFRADSLGYEKIKRCCETAASDGFNFVWIDTCCIDKTSSAELSEAINSMYKWYQGSVVCYAYLSDVPGSIDHEAQLEAFSQSRWFTRGWTLQELIAPRHVTFFDQDWEEIGTRASMESFISSITKIHAKILRPGARNGTNLSDFSVAQRMSWASKRQTTRIEDIAYCLMGLFNVNMPMLYGEGENAFTRLQEEIIRKSDDQTIFAWKTTFWNVHGLLAHSPTAFTDCGDLVRSNEKHSVVFSLTNRGVHIELPLIGWRYGQTPSSSLTSIGILDCRHESGDTKRLGIYLEKLSGRGGQFKRVLYHECPTVDVSEAEKVSRQHIYIKLFPALRVPPQNPLMLDYMQLYDRGIELLQVYPSSLLVTDRRLADNRLMIMPISKLEFGALDFEYRPKWSQGSSRSSMLFTILISTSFETSHIPRIEIMSWPAETQMPLSDSLDSLLATFRANKDTFFTNTSDRIMWQHPVKKWWLKVAIRQRLYALSTAHVLEIDCSTVENSPPRNYVVVP